jgi:hypothetical protein
LGSTIGSGPDVFFNFFLSPNYHSALHQNTCAPAPAMYDAAAAAVLFAAVYCCSVALVQVCNSMCGGCGCGCGGGSPRSFFGGHRRALDVNTVLDGMPRPWEETER